MIVIFLVVIGHVIITVRVRSEASFHPLVLRAIYDFHMPFFFLMSGALFDEKRYEGVPFADFFLGKVRTILVPYLTFESIGAVYHILADHMTVRRVLWNMFTGHVNVGANWFLLAFFGGEILFFLLLRCRVPWYVTTAVFLASSQFFPLIIDNKEVYGAVSFPALLLYRSIIAVFCIFGGYYLKKFVFAKTDKGLFVTAAVLLVLTVRYNSQIDICDGHINDPILFCVGGLAGTYLVLAVSRGLAELPGSGLLAFIGRNAITIMGTHHLVIYYIRTFTELGAVQSDAPAILGIILAVELPLVYLFDKFLPPFLLGRKKK